MTNEQIKNMESVLAHEHGFSVIEIVLGVAITLLVAFVITSVVRINFKANQRIADNLDRQGLTRLVLSKLSCEESLPTGRCRPRTILPLYDKDGKVIVPAGGGSNTQLRIGAFAVRTQCNNRGDGLLVKAARLKKGQPLTASRKSSFNAEPVSGEIWTYRHPKASLLPSGTSLCAKKTPQVAGKFDLDVNCQNCRRTREVTGYTFCALSRAVVGTNYDTDSWGCSVKLIDASQGRWSLTTNHYDRRDNRFLGCSMNCMK